MRLPKTVVFCLGLPCLAAGFTRAVQLASPHQQPLSQHQPQQLWTPALEEQSTEEQKRARAIRRYQAQAYYYANVQHRYKEARECLLAAERLQSRLRSSLTPRSRGDEPPHQIVDREAQPTAQRQLDQLQAGKIPVWNFISAGKPPLPPIPEAMP